MNRIPPNELAPIRDARLRSEVAAQAVRILELQVFVRHHLFEGDSFDLDTGVITMRSPAPAAPEPSDG